MGISTPVCYPIYIPAWARVGTEFFFHLFVKKNSPCSHTATLVWGVPYNVENFLYTGMGPVKNTHRCFTLCLLSQKRQNVRFLSARAIFPIDL